MLPDSKMEDLKENLRNREAISKAHGRWLEPPDTEADDRQRWKKEGRAERDEIAGERERKSE